MADVFKSLSDRIDAFVDAHPNTLGIVAATAAQTMVDVSQGVYGVATGHGPEVADWFDTRVQQSQAILRQAGDDIVDRHPNMLGVVAATALNAIPGTAMVLGQAQVDVARIGTGVKEGTWGGVAKDGLRALSLLAPAAKATKFVYGRVALAYKDPAKTLGACLPVSITKALAHTGQTGAFARLDAMVGRLANNPIGKASLNQGRAMAEMSDDLTRIGAKFSLTQVPAKLNDLKELTRANPGGVTVFGARWKMPIDGKMEDVGHALYSFVDGMGTLRIADRSGAVVKSLKELEKFYPNIGTASLSGLAMQVPQARYLTNMLQGGGLGLAVNAVRMVPESNFRDRVRDFFKSGAAKRPMAPARR